MCCVETLEDDEAFHRALRDKLVEEAGEAADAPDSDVATELTDLQEVMEALVEVYGLAPAAVRGCHGTAVLLATGQLPT